MFHILLSEYRYLTLPWRHLWAVDIGSTDTVKWAWIDVNSGQCAKVEMSDRVGVK